MALTDKLSAIGDAIREKGGTTELLTLDEMPVAIAAIESGLNEMVMTGNVASLFSGNTANGNWLIPYFDYIKTEDITNCAYLFNNNTLATRVPFEINLKEGSSLLSSNNMFMNADNIEYIAPIRNFGGNVEGMFSGIKKLVHCPEFPDVRWGTIYSGSTSSSSGMFYNCWNLRTIPTSFLEAAYDESNTYTKFPFHNAFYGCHCLDEIVGLSPRTGSTEIAGNMFPTNTFKGLQHCKDIIFATQFDGAPYECNWKNQIIYMTGIGYGSSIWNIIGEEYEVKDDATYAALKDNPNWFSEKLAYSRYNHDSAVRTINSMPDCSSSMSYGQTTQTNIINFTGNSGEYTDGGAINTLTEEEIAVATAKNWSVAFE